VERKAKLNEGGIAGVVVGGLALVALVVVVVVVVRRRRSQSDIDSVDLS